jgi:hypothetical protein
MNEETFWSMIEDAWGEVGGKTEVRGRLVRGDVENVEVNELMDDLNQVLESLRTALTSLDKDPLVHFDRILERKLYELDRAEIQEQTDGSEDGFLYARGFIVVMGESYFDAVNAYPPLALMDTECEEICYLPLQVYEQRFGEMPSSGISRESRSNKLGWEGA